MRSQLPTKNPLAPPSPPPPSLSLGSPAQQDSWKRPCIPHAPPRPSPPLLASLPPTSDPLLPGAALGNLTPGHRPAASASGPCPALILTSPQPSFDPGGHCLLLETSWPLEPPSPASLLPLGLLQGGKDHTRGPRAGPWGRGKDEPETGGLGPAPGDSGPEPDTLPWVVHQVFSLLWNSHSHRKGRLLSNSCSCSQLLLWVLEDLMLIHSLSEWVLGGGCNQNGKTGYRSLPTGLPWGFYK